MPKPLPFPAGRTPLTFAEALAEIHSSKYTGPITLHCQHGVLYTIELPVRESIKVPLKPSA
jgi:hypothetical protein